MTILILGLLLFLGIHSIRIVAEPARQGLIERLGLWGYKGLYSAIALVGFGLIIVGYGQARLEPTVLYQLPVGVRHMSLLLLVPAFPALLAAYFPGRISDKLKHPMLVAVKIWAVAHLLANGTLADVLLFGGFLTWAVLDRISVGRRASTGGGAQLPRTPFNDVIVIAGGLGLYVAFLFWLHPLLIGVPAVG